MRRFTLAASLLLVALFASPARAQDAAGGPVFLAANTSASVSSSEASLSSAFRRAYYDWSGTRYRLGGMSRSGIDCSALMLVWFRSLFGVNLPRTAAQQALQGERVGRSDLRVGDLVFFAHPGSSRIAHVGVYVGSGEFAHSSSSQGVSVSSLSSSYWGPRYRTARRMLGGNAEVSTLAAAEMDFDAALLELQNVDLSDFLGADAEGDEGMGEEANAAPAPVVQSVGRW